jgi:hypothetical protein
MDNDGPEAARRLDWAPVLRAVVDAIRRTPFDAVLSEPSRVFGDVEVRDAPSQVASDLADLARVVPLAEFGRLVGEGKAVRLVFSENTKRGLRSGDLAMPTDKSSGLRRAEARDGAGRIREGARFQELDKWERLSHGLVAVARVISALDVETQIERLILPRFGGHHSEGVDGVHGGAEEAAYSPQIH